MATGQTATSRSMTSGNGTTTRAGHENGRELDASEQRLRGLWRAQGMPEAIVRLWAAEGFASPLDVAQSFVDVADLRGTLPEGIPADHAESAVDYYVGAVRDKGAAIQRMAGTLPRGTLTEGSLTLASGGRIAASTSLRRESILPVRAERPHAVPNGRASVPALAAVGGSIAAPG